MSSTLILAILLGVSFTVLSVATITATTLYMRKRKKFNALVASSEPRKSKESQGTQIKKAVEIMQHFKTGMTEEDVNFVTNLLLHKADMEATSAEFQSLDIESRAVDEETKAWVVGNFLIPHNKLALSNDSANNSMQDASIRRPSILKKAGSNDFQVYRRVSVSFTGRINRIY